jgi:hypothetical protein
MTELARGLRPRTPPPSGSLALAPPTGHSLRSVTVLTRRLHP